MRQIYRSTMKKSPILVMLTSEGSHATNKELINRDELAGVTTLMKSHVTIANTEVLLENSRAIFSENCQ